MTLQLKTFPSREFTDLAALCVKAIEGAAKIKRAGLPNGMLKSRSKICDCVSKKILANREISGVQRRVIRESYKDLAAGDYGASVTKERSQPLKVRKAMRRYMSSCVRIYR